MSFNCATIDGDTSTNDSFVIVATGKARRSTPIAHAGRSAPRADSRRADRGRPPRSRRRSSATAKGATKFIDDSRRGRARRRRMPADRARHRAFAARQDRVLRLRPQPRPDRLRDRQRRGARPGPIARVRSGLDDVQVVVERCARARRTREKRRPARDEAATRSRSRVALGRGDAAATDLDLRLLARLRQHQRRLPELTWPPRAKSAALFARLEGILDRVEAMLPPAGAAARLDAPPPFAGAERAGRGFLQAVPPSARRSGSTISSRSTSRSTRSTRTRASSSRAAREQRAPDRLARHRQVVADQGDARQVCGEGPAPDRGRQGRSRRAARHRRNRRGAARAVHRLLRRPHVRRRRAGLQGAEGDARRNDRRAVGRTC